MRLGSFLVRAALFAGLTALALPSRILSQEPGFSPATVADLPESPLPQLASAAADPGAQAGQSQSAPSSSPGSSLSSSLGSASGQSSAAAQAPAVQSGSSSQSPAPQTDEEKRRHDLAEEQLKQQEKQRVMGVMATFNTTRNPEAVPLSPGQKFQLFFKSSTDPWPFGLAAVVSGIGQADNSYPEWGQGVQGYAKRYGAAYSDYFIGNFFGNAVLPTIWHEDPRYFQKGTGSVAGRFLWAAASTGWCKRDSGGWGPNYANVIGNLIGAGIARAYYPASERTVTNTITDGLTVSAEGILGAEVIEFWPDAVRYQRRKHAEKLARQAAKASQGISSAP